MTVDIRVGDVREGLAQLAEGSVPELREIPGVPGYAVSKDGRVWSRRCTLRDVESGRLVSSIADGWRELRPRPHRKGYPSVAPCINGRNVIMAVHRLVLLAWVGPAPRGCEACHNNGDRSDARLENLRWDTRKANHADKHLHGTALLGKRNPASKLSEAQVSEIRSRRMAGERVVDLARAFRLHPVYVSNICRRLCR